MLELFVAQAAASTRPTDHDPLIAHAKFRRVNS
jgi:hypothetical protein